MNEDKTISYKVELSRQICAAGRGRASKLLLGLEEQRQLIEEAESWGFYTNPRTMFSKTGDARVEYRGLKVYPVDDEKYCEVAP